MNKQQLLSLPSGWTLVRFKDIVREFQPGFACGKRDEKGYIQLRMNNIGLAGKLVLESLLKVPKSETKLDKYRLEKGDVIFNNTNSPELVGKTVLFNGEIENCVYSNHLTRIRVYEDIALPEFVTSFLRLEQRKGTFELLCRRFVGQAAVPRESLLNLELLLPPLNEQRRMIERMKLLFSESNSAEQSLAKIPIIIRKLRKSVIEAATSGSLTSEWRSRKGEKWPDEFLPLQSLLPKGGIFDGPFGSNLKTSDYTDSGVRVIRLENIGRMHFIGSKRTYISPQKYETLKKHTVHKGDLIFSSFLEEEVRACILPELDTLAIAKADCFCIRPNGEMIMPEYLLLQLSSPQAFTQLVEMVHGATRPRVNTTQLKTLKTPVCSLEEQSEIVRRFYEMSKMIDDIEKQYLQAKSAVDKIDNTLLHKAFRGELVPQDPNDEPASVLLEKIRNKKH